MILNGPIKNVFYGLYKEHPTSFFGGGDLAAKGLPTEAELKILEPYRDSLPKEVFTSEFTFPVTKGDGNIRPLIRQAQALLKEAGYGVREGKMVHSKTGKPLTFEILLNSPQTERILQGFLKNLEAIGLKATLKVVESAQYIQRVNDFNYDMVGDMSLQSVSPGNEQREFWGTKAANRPGSRNFIGIQSKAVDEIIEKMIEAQTREDLVNHVKALDRILMWGHYVVSSHVSQRYAASLLAKNETFRKTTQVWSRFGCLVD